MTKQEVALLNKYGIYYDEDINLRQGIVDLFNPHVFYTDGKNTHVLDYGKYIKVEYTNGFWGGFFGAADSINLKVYNIKQLRNILEFIEALKHWSTTPP